MPDYAAIDIGALLNSSFTSWTLAVNNSGVAVGSCRRAVGVVDGGPEAFRYESDVATLLASPFWSLAFGINDATPATIVGVVESAPGGPKYAPALWTDGSFTDLSAVVGERGEARDINDAGFVVGWVDVQAGGDSFPRGFILNTSNNHVVRGLLLSGGKWSVAAAINGDGQVIGWAGVPNTEPVSFFIQRGFPWDVAHAFVFKDGQFTDLDSGNMGSAAFGINAAGVVVGAFRSAPIPWGSGEFRFAHAFRYTDAEGMKDIQPPGVTYSVARAINGRGDVVGEMSRPEAESEEAFLYIGSDAKWANLNEKIDTGSGWVLKRAFAINDAGMIGGFGTHNDRPTAFLLVPVYTEIPRRGAGGLVGLVQILWGAIQGGDGVGILPGGGIVRIPPRGPVREVMSGLAIMELAATIEDPQLRLQIQQAVREVIIKNANALGR